MNQISIHSALNQQLASASYCLYKLFQYTSQPQNEWLHLQMQALSQMWLHLQTRRCFESLAPPVLLVVKNVVPMVMLWRLRQIWALWGSPDLTGNRRLCQCFLCSAFVERTVKVEVINEVKTEVPHGTCVE